MRRWQRDEWKNEPPGSAWRRRELLVDEKAWPTVQADLHDIDALLPSRHVDIRYGLARVELSLDVDDVLRGKLAGAGAGAGQSGRNRLVAFGTALIPDVALGDIDVDGQPKIWGSAELHGPKRAAKRLPRRHGARLGEGITVGVVDTGIATPPPSWLLGATLFDHTDTLPRPSNDENGRMAAHGTFVTGLILEQAPGAAVRIVGVLSEDGVAESVDVHDAICRLAEAGVDIVSMSLGCLAQQREAPLALRHALAWARRVNPNIVFVASAGNTASNEQFWPAADKQVWAVAAAHPVESKKPPVAAGAQTAPAARPVAGWELTPYSGRGSWVDVAAPGDNLVSAWTPRDGGRDDEWGIWSGTSMATAVVSGVIAARLRPGGKDGRFVTPTDVAAKSLADGGTLVSGQVKLPLLGTTTTVWE